MNQGLAEKFDKEIVEMDADRAKFILRLLLVANSIPAAKIYLAIKIANECGVPTSEVKR